MEFNFLRFLVLNFSQYQIYGLFFLLGSLAVATISDLKKMAAQKEFFQLWILFTVVMFLVDMRPLLAGGNIGAELITKWILIGVLALISHNRVGILFHLKKMDVAAIAAVVSLFNLYSVLIFFPLLKLVSLVQRPVLKSGNRYPFIPSVFTSVSIILVVNLVLI